MSERKSPTISPSIIRGKGLDGLHGASKLNPTYIQNGLHGATSLKPTPTPAPQKSSTETTSKK